MLKILLIALLVLVVAVVIVGMFVFVCAWMVTDCLCENECPPTRKNMEQ